MPRWRITYYSLPSGKFPVKDFIDNLPGKYQTKVFNSFELLEEFGLFLGRPHLKKLAGTSLWELRLLGEKSLRFIFTARPNQELLMLHCFVKKTNKTPKKELKTALKRSRY